MAKPEQEADRASRELLTAGLEPVREMLRRALEPAQRAEVHEKLRIASAQMNNAAVDQFVRSYQEAIRRLFAGLSAESHETGGSRRSWQALRLVLSAEHTAADALTSPWVAAYENEGLWLDVLARIRASQSDAEPLPVPEFSEESARWLDEHEEQVAQFHRLVLRALSRLDQPPPLDRVREVFALSLTELGELFSVSRQAGSQWLEAGKVPPERQEKLATIAAIADLLDRKLKAGRVPGVARREAEAYGGQTMLAAIAEDRHRDVLESVRASFDWSATP